MLNRKLAAVAAALIAVSLFAFQASADTSGSTVNITVDASKDRKAISPYIYGTNAELMNNDTLMKSVRAGGNRYTAYNWENNASNAGSDWKNNSDGYFQQSVDESLRDKPGCIALQLADVCKKKGAYPLMTLQLAGYVAADTNGEVSASEKAPSDRWNKVEMVKGSDFTLTPDLNDGTVYMDEFVNYLVQTLGDSQNGGIRGYSLDNEPGLWSTTHSRIHPDRTSCAEIVEKSVTMSKAVKAIDPNADIFGPALFGYGAFTNFAGAEDWNIIRADHPEYRWFIDYYLEEMKKAEDECGTRLLDVLDVHFYTEAKGACGERYCQHYNDPDCVKNKLNATRSMWDDTYTEDSWITDTGAEFLPILPALKQSVDTYYPGTKIAITEYDFQGAYDVTGAVMEADALGIFAQNEVYCANLFSMDAQYQLAGIDLYTNYDGQGSGFGDTLVSCVSDDIETSTAYAAIDGDNTDVLRVVVTNKSFAETTTANISLGEEYGYVHLYGINDMAAKVFDMSDTNPAVKLDGSSVTLEMQPRTVSLLVIAKNKDALTSASESVPAGQAETKEVKRNFTPVLAGAGALAVAAAAVFAVRKRKK
ncbi:Glycoside hydrolase family 44 [Ruminococcus sp. YE71]|uniref:glycoside hydrolase family 44 protein n=1 Tax=unclassified Ruminococcus TaxID=2608920 RepID=UPI000880FAF7|nr:MULTISPECIES: glycoside hydrolase family 44 protein [unclassified Ruminococcus]SDA22772.1 Glycoside hydrolase family 44 [Ruminococcus sp. YE78]SFW38772.1 Glycoside hydrolase family 44 [Ruminococcus sp. YE71]